MSFHDAKARWQTDRAQFAARGAILGDVVAYMTPEMRADFTLAMDAVPAAFTAPNSGIPAYLNTLVDPEVFEILFAPNNATKILKEVKKGTWLDETAVFPTVEHTGEVSSYGDWNTNGRAGANANWPARQAYLFQTMKIYGERELERAGLARINWVAEIDKAAATVMKKFENLSYMFGVAGLQNYGLTNDPNLPAAISPATKAAGNGNVWVYNGLINGTANEIFADIQALFIQLVTQTQGLVDAKSAMVLTMSPTLETALTTTNSFNVSVNDLLKKNFPNLRIETCVQFGALSAANPQGVAAGNLMQLMVESLEGQDTGYCAYNEKMRSHAVIKLHSSFEQKLTGGVWGAVIRQPLAIAQMIGL